MSLKNVHCSHGSVAFSTGRKCHAMKVISQIWSKEKYITHLCCPKMIHWVCVCAKWIPRKHWTWLITPYMRSAKISWPTHLGRSLGGKCDCEVVRCQLTRGQIMLSSPAHVLVCTVHLCASQILWPHILYVHVRAVTVLEKRNWWSVRGRVRRSIAHCYWFIHFITIKASNFEWCMFCSLFFYVQVE